jgi:alpha-1,2-mannosyltransferase
MFHAATAVLPSSFTMLAVLAIWTSWLRGSHGPAIFVAVYTILLVWPFSVLLYVPLGLAALVAPEFGLLKVLGWGIGSSLLLGGLDMAYNSLYYGRPLLASWEIFYYNVLQDNGGPELYGTEPASFYAVNLALNFNGAFVLAAALPAALPLAALFTAGPGGNAAAGPGMQLVYLAPLYIWFCFYSSLPHKEERFLCPCYPLLCLAAAASLGESAQSTLPTHTGRTLALRAAVSAPAHILACSACSLALDRRCGPHLDKPV